MVVRVQGQVMSQPMVCYAMIAELTTSPRRYRWPNVEPGRAHRFHDLRCRALMRTVFDSRVRRLGLTRAQWLALTRLHRRPGASQSELADMMEVEKATVGRLIRPTGGQGLGRASRASRRPPRQPRLPDRRSRAPAPAHLAHRRGNRRGRSCRAVAARGRPAPQIARPRQVEARRHSRRSSSAARG